MPKQNVLKDKVSKMPKKLKNIYNGIYRDFGDNQNVERTHKRLLNF